MLLGIMLQNWNNAAELELCCSKIFEKRYAAGLELCCNFKKFSDNLQVNSSEIYNFYEPTKQLGKNIPS